MRSHTGLGKIITQTLTFFSQNTQLYLAFTTQYHHMQTEVFVRYK